MSWKAFVTTTMGSDQQKDAAAKMGVNASTVSRWLTSGEPGEAKNVIGFARAYGVPPLAALVAAGLLTEAEARMRPASAPNLEGLTNDELLELVRARMREEVMGNAEHPAATKEPDEQVALAVVGRYKRKTKLSAGPTTTEDAVAALEKATPTVGEQGADEHP